MAATKTHDIAIKVGEYEVQGEKKNRYKNIGAMMEGDNGPFLLLDTTILGMSVNYVANPKRQERIIVSLFEVKDRDDRGGGNNRQQQSKGDARGNIGRGDDRGDAPAFDDEIPF